MMTVCPSLRIDIGAHLVRVEENIYARPVDEFANPYGDTTVKIIARRYKITSYTACGAWINVNGEKRFVNLRATKQWACASMDEARAAFRHRKLAQIRILSEQIRNAQRALALLP